MASLCTKHDKFSARASTVHGLYIIKKNAWHPKITKILEILRIMRLLYGIHAPNLLSWTIRHVITLKGCVRKSIGSNFIFFNLIKNIQII